MTRPDPAPQQTPTAGHLTREAIAGLVRQAALAPSMHNTQPWRFEFSEPSQAIAMFVDVSRTLPHSDRSGRAAHIACGAALFNLRLAIMAAGRQPVARLLPEPGQPLLLATVRLGGTYRPGQEERDLAAAIPARHTNRQPFSSRPVPLGVRARLAEAAAMEGAVLQFPGHTETVRLLRLAADAERDLLADPAYTGELARWAGGDREQDGIPDSALGPRDPVGQTPVRDFTPGRAAPAGYAWFEETPQLAVLSTHGGTRTDWLRAGQAMQRVLLTATAWGISVSPLTQPLETADAWLVRDPQAGSQQPQMILRIGYGLPVPPAPRRPVPDILSQGQGTSRP